ITEGKNRELRRFFGHFDAKILDLKRVGYGGVELNNLPENKTRYFSRKEYDDLHQFMKRKKKNLRIAEKNEYNAQQQVQKSQKRPDEEDPLSDFKKEVKEAFKRFK
ncbi:MAG: pseudouridine synthase, partial [Sulfurovum sp.]